MYDGAVIAGAVEVPYRRRPPGVDTLSLLAAAFAAALDETGLEPRDIDGLGISSFTLAPDHAIDVAWRLGLRLRWSMEDTHGGASGINMLQHSVRAVQAGDASVIVLLSADHFEPADFVRLNETYNRTVRDHLAPLPFGGPNALFALVTQAHMRRHGLSRADYGRVCIAQRAWAGLNPGAAYRAPMTIEEYLASPMVADPLGRLDCVPVVSGADAIVVAREDRLSGPAVRVRAIKALHNRDDQGGDGTETGIRTFAPALWDEAGFGPPDVDLVEVYDDYPVMVLAQLADLGFDGGDPRRLIAEQISTRRLPVNTSGGQLSAGQAGAAGGMHGLVEAVNQLRRRVGERQVPGARRAVVSGYGMVEYRYCLCANAVVLEGDAP